MPKIAWNRKKPYQHQQHQQYEGKVPGTKYFKQFVSNFLAPYGQSYDELQESRVFNRCTTFNCEWLKRPEIALSELAETLPMNLQKIVNGKAPFIDKDAFEEGMEGIHNFISNLAPLSRKNEETPTNDNLFETLSTLTLEDKDMDTFFKQCYSMGGALFLIGAHFLTAKALFTNLDKYAARMLPGVKQLDKFKRNHDIQHLAAYLKEELIPAPSRKTRKSKKGKQIQRQLASIFAKGENTSQTDSDTDSDTEDSNSTSSDSEDEEAPPKRLSKKEVQKQALQMLQRKRAKAAEKKGTSAKTGTQKKRHSVVRESSSSSSESSEEESSAELSTRKLPKQTNKGKQNVTKTKRKSSKAEQGHSHVKSGDKSVITECDGKKRKRSRGKTTQQREQELPTEGGEDQEQRHPEHGEMEEAPSKKRKRRQDHAIRTDALPAPIEDTQLDDNMVPSKEKKSAKKDKESKKETKAIEQQQKLQREHGKVEEEGAKKVKRTEHRAALPQGSQEVPGAVEDKEDAENDLPRKRTKKPKKDKQRQKDN